MSSEASAVRPITPERGLECRYIKTVEYAAKLRGVGRTFDLVHEAGDNGLRNAVAAAGGNAYVITRMDADALWGKVNYAGQAFQCPARTFESPAGIAEHP